MDRTMSELARLLQGGAIPPFVYAYPTRSAYRPLSPSWTLERVWEEDKEHSLTDDLNIYVHVPFCGYKCGFCNLYTTICRDEDVFDAYVDALCADLWRHTPILAGRIIRTVYIGGGTPTLLRADQLERIFRTLDEVKSEWRRTVEEVCIEASPDSVVDRNGNLIAFLRELGLTRANLGVQSLVESELRSAGRARAARDVVLRAIDIIRETGLPNLSTDLIMGFADQTTASWEKSVRELVALSPETISTYFLTVRPDAWFSRRADYVYKRDPELYRRYDVAREILLESGYSQESNVRYKQPTGGYRQKVLQFHGVPVLGLGAGARTYTNTVDYCTLRGQHASLDAVWQYIDAVRRNQQTLQSGYVYDDNERVRKRLVLDLFDLDLQELQPYGVERHRSSFEGVLAACLEFELAVAVTPTHYKLTPRGYKYRDIISWMLFSPAVRDLDRQFYEDLHRGNEPARRTIGRNPKVTGLIA